MKTPRRRRFGHLDSIFVEGSPEGATVVLFHGYGADMTDLAPLANVVQAPKGTNWVFPQGHIAIPLGGHYEGRAWFPISISELEKSMASGIAMDFSQIVPPGLKRARENALELIHSLDVPSERLLLGGFSQGAMLATEVALEMSQPPAGLALLSGTLVNRDSWKERAAKFKGFEFFQSHGARDTVLGINMAVALEKLFQESGWVGRLQKFEGGHEIPSEVLIQLGAYMRKRLGNGR